MLRFLRIKHLAVIDSVEVEFDPGLNVLTGETGAGKSILVEAVGLLLGGRASGDLVRTGEDAAAIEAIFESGGEELLVRREITAQGRSRAFINGALATAGALKDLSNRLIELHGQHEHQTLLDPVDASRRARRVRRGSSALSTPTAAAFDAHARRARTSSRACAPRPTDRDARLDLVDVSARRARSRARSSEPAEDERAGRARGRCWRAPSASSGCAPRATPSLYESDDAVLGGAGRRLAARRRAGGARSAVPAVSRGARRHQVAARGSRRLPPPLRRRHRSVAGAAAAGGGAARAARAAEAQVRADAGRRHRAPRRAAARARRSRARRRADRRARARAARPRATAYLAAAPSAVERARAASRAAFARALETLLAELAMERTRFEVRFDDEPLPEAAWTRARHRPRRVLRVAEPRRGPAAAGAHRLGRRAVAHHARDQDADRDDAARLQRRRRSAAERVGARADLRRGRRRHRRPRRRRRRPQAARARLRVPGALHHAPAADRRLRRHALPDREAGRAAAGRRRRVRRLDGDGRVEELARMLGGEAITDGLRASAREMLAERRREGDRSTGERERRKRKSASRRKRKGERRKS